MQKNKLLSCEKKPENYWDKVLIYSDGSMLLRFYRFLEKIKKRYEKQKNEKLQEL